MYVTIAGLNYIYTINSYSIFYIYFKKDINFKNVSIVRSLTTRFLIRHVTSGCLLRSSGKTLPEWGFKQAEVVCQKKADKKSTANMWNVEQHWNDKRKFLFYFIVASLM